VTRPTTINAKYDYCEEKIRKHAYVSVDQELATCGEWGSGSCVEVQGGGDDEAEPEPAQSFTEALRVFESMRAFMYAHDITERDQANIADIESLLFKLKKKGATKQMKSNYFLKKK
jgi:hypothetical protein